MEPDGKPQSRSRRERHRPPARPTARAPSTAPPTWSPTVVRADEPLTFADLQDACGLAKSTTSRMLTALERSGLLERDAAGVLRRRPALLAVRRPPRPVGGAGPAGPARPWSRSARTPARPCTSASPAATASCRSPRSTRRYLLGTRDWTEVDVPAALLGARQGLLRLGRAAAARRARSRRRPRRTLADPGALRRDGERARERGWARHRSTSSRSASPASPYPSSGPAATLVAALGISGPTPRLEERLDELGRSLLDHAAQLSDPAARRTTHKEGGASHDSGGDPARPVRRDAGRQRPARPRADQRGARRSTWSRRRCSSTR